MKKLASKRPTCSTASRRSRSAAPTRNRFPKCGRIVRPPIDEGAEVIAGLPVHQLDGTIIEERIIHGEGHTVGHEHA
jgi:hypothetical protein